MAKYRENGINISPGAGAAVYTRVSSNMQRAASLEDQERNSRKYATKKNWTVLDGFVKGDMAKSGRKLDDRDGLDFLMTAATDIPRPFDILIMDEPSRMGRKVEHVLKHVDKLKHLGIVVVFATRRMQSDDPNFMNNLMLQAANDQMSSEILADGVHRGQEGRALDGYSTGSRCFGYRSVMVPDPMKPWSHSRADALGTKWVVIPEEAAIINRIHEMFVDGWTTHQITLQLNDEKVPAARATRVDSPPRFWNSTLIKRILHNKKYVGKGEWNKTNQVINPETEKTETRKNPRDVWTFRDLPELRIVSDDLRARAEARFEIVNEKMTNHRMGGLNRAKKRTYLFGGLLYCGSCGSRMTIGASAGRGRGPAYGCPMRRYRRGCTNNLWIREDRLSAQLLQALTKNLLQPHVMDYFIATVAEEFDTYLKGKKGVSLPPENVSLSELL